MRLSAPDDTRGEVRRELVRRRRDNRHISYGRPKKERANRAADRECPAPGWRADGHGCTSREPNTHNTESREVCYPWHPWFGRRVAVYERRVKYGQAVCRSGLENKQNRGSVEIPTWMFESAACCRLRVMAVPTVGCDALLELKVLLRAAPRPGSGSVLQAQHRSLLTAGGADATVREPTTTRATHALSSSAPAAVVSEAAIGDSSGDDQVAGSAAPRPRRPSGRLRRRTGGA